MKDLKIADDLREIVNVLNEGDTISLLLIDELVDNWHKRQIFRTETEMRVSVLNDANHPTVASKYWQSVREMAAQFDELVNFTFDLRKNTLDKLRLDKKIQDLSEHAELNRFDIMEANIDLDRNLYSRQCMLQIGKDRVRELNLWSILKKELDDSSFDSIDVNVHQSDSLHKYFENRVSSLNASSDPAEIMNAMGPYLSFNRMKNDEGKLLNFLGEVSEDTKKKLN